MKLLVTAVLLALGLLACSARQQLDLNASGGGRVELEFSLPSYLLEQADALQQNLPPGTPDFFDPLAVKQQLLANPAVKNPVVESAARGKMKISWEFTNLNLLLSGGTQKEGQLLRQTLRLVKMADGRSRLELSLTRSNYEQLLAENAILATNPIIQYYGPAVTAEASPDDYRDLIAFAFGEEARAALELAQFQLDISTPRPLLKVERGRKMAANRARFVLNLMDVLYFKGTELYALEY